MNKINSLKNKMCGIFFSILLLVGVTVSLIIGEPLINFLPINFDSIINFIGLVAIMFTTLYSFTFALSFDNEYLYMKSFCSSKQFPIKSFTDIYQLGTMTYEFHVAERKYPYRLNFFSKKDIEPFLNELRRQNPFCYIQI